MPEAGIPAEGPACKGLQSGEDTGPPAREHRGKPWARCLASSCLFLLVCSEGPSEHVCGHPNPHVPGLLPALQTAVPQASGSCCWQGVRSLGGQTAEDTVEDPRSQLGAFPGMWSRKGVGGSGESFPLATDSLPCGRGRGSEGRGGLLEPEPQSLGLCEVLLLPDKKVFPLGKFEIRTISGHWIQQTLHPALCTAPTVNRYPGLGPPFPGWAPSTPPVPTWAPFSVLLPSSDSAAGCVPAEGSWIWL